MKPRYEILRRGTTFNQFGPSPETLISKHSTIKAARKAFADVVGHAVLVEIYGTTRTTIDARLI